MWTVLIGPDGFHIRGGSIVCRKSLTGSSSRKCIEFFFHIFMDDSNQENRKEHLTYVIF